MCCQESRPPVTTWAPGPTTVMALTGTTDVTDTAMIKLMTGGVRGVTTAAKMAGAVMKAAPGAAETAVVSAAGTRAMTLTAMKASAKKMGLAIDAGFTGGSETAAVVMKAAPGVQVNRAMTAVASKASAMTMVKAADAGFAERKNVDTEEKAATTAAAAATVGAVRATATMMGTVAVVECGERNMVAAMGVAVGVGPFKR